MQDRGLRSGNLVPLLFLASERHRRKFAFFGSFCGHQPFDGGDESISTTRQRFNVARVLGVIAERVADLFDREVQAMFEIDESLVPPDLAPKLFTRDELPRLAHQQKE